MSGDTLRVPKDKLSVIVHLETGTKLDGLIFLEELPYIQQVHQKVASFLEEETIFFPLILTDSGKVEFINKTNILMVECGCQAEHETDDFYMGIMHIENITAIFNDETKISGALMAEVPKEKARLSDCLNLHGSFLKLKADGRLFFLNKSKLQKVLYR